LFEGRARPEIVVIGAEISEVRRCTDELMPRQEAAINRAVRLVRRELIGHAPG
jgi:hypothetical protein